MASIGSDLPKLYVLKVQGWLSRPLLSCNSFPPITERHRPPLFLMAGISRVIRKHINVCYRVGCDLAIALSIYSFESK